MTGPDHQAVWQFPIFRTIYSAPDRRSVRSDKRRKFDFWPGLLGRYVIIILSSAMFLLTFIVIRLIFARCTAARNTITESN